MVIRGRKHKLNISFLLFLNIKIAGLEKIDIHKRLNAYVPIKDKICIISILCEKL